MTTTMTEPTTANPRKCDACGIYGSTQPRAYRKGKRIPLTYTEDGDVLCPDCLDEEAQR